MALVNGGLVALYLYEEIIKNSSLTEKKGPHGP